MEGVSLGMIAVLAVLLGGCVIGLLGTFHAIKNAHSAGQRQRTARATLVTWGLLALVVPAILLAALGVLPSWIYATGAVAALAIAVLATRLINRRATRLR